jgi:monoamine oxidase
MARSPWLRVLSLAHRAHRIARQAGVPVDEVVARKLEATKGARDGGLRRREVLKAAGLVGALPLLKACPPPEPPLGDKQTVGIVGAGMAGLHCAHRLKQLGITATIYEAQSRLGGRMFSDRTTFAPQHCELGGELIDTGHVTMLDLATELDIALLDYRDDDPALDEVVAFFNGGKVALADILTAYGPIAARIDADLATIGGDGFVYYNEHNNGEALDAQSIKSWFDALVDDGTIAADNIARQLFEVAYNIEYGRETDEQSVLNMHFLTSTSTDELALFGDSDERFHTRDGNDTFITKLAAKLDGQIETERKLTKIAQRSDGRITLSFEQGDDVTHDHVVLALPFTMLREVDMSGVTLSDAKAKAIAELGYGTNAKLMVGFDARAWRTGTPGSNGETFTDLGYQSTWETSRLQDGDAGIITNFTGGDAGVAAGDGTPDDQAASFLGQFEQVFPGVADVANGKVARFHWPTNPFVKASYACYLVGQYTTITGSEAEPEGNLHFCGEHTSLDAQGYMEGAALTGAAIADEVAEALGVDASAFVSEVERALTVETAETRILRRARTVRARRRWKQRALV